MFWLTERISATHFVILSLSPVLGLIISHYLSEKFIKRLFLYTISFVASSLTGYYILWDGLYILAVLVIVPIVFIYLFKFLDFKHSKIWAMASTVFLFLISLFYYFISAYSGEYSSEFVCRNHKYKIESVEYNAFSGRAVPIYVLYYSPLWGLLNKQLQTIRIDSVDPRKTCMIDFTEYNVVFDQCNHLIIKHY